MAKGINSLEGITPGDFYHRRDDEVWEVVSLCEHPTVTLVNTKTGRKINAAIGSPFALEFTKVR